MSELPYHLKPGDWSDEMLFVVLRRANEQVIGSVRESRSKVPKDRWEASGTDSSIIRYFPSIAAAAAWVWSRSEGPR